MLCRVLLFLALIIGGFFAFRYFSLLYAMKKTEEEIREIQQDLTQNQMLHLPVPSPALGRLLNSFNKVLEEIREERIGYEHREKEFQKQIENISHDLRTPLTVILGYLKLIKKSQSNQITVNEELEEAMDIIRHKAESMKNLVTQFYDFSRLNAGDYELSLGKVDVSRTLRESLMGNYQILEQTHLEIDIDIPERPIWGSGDEAALERIFLNLFQNAGRYAETFLYISIKEYERNVSVSFSNDTQILSEDDLSHLFERFYMQNDSRNQGGTGLGLTVAKSLAEEMGATLNVTILDKNSAKDKSTICFELCMKKI